MNNINIKHKVKKQRSSWRYADVCGVLICAARGKFGFVSTGTPGKDIYIHSDNFGGANHGDTVRVRVFVSFHGKNREGAVIEVLSRSEAVLSAVVGAEYDEYVVAYSDDARFYPPIRIPKEVSLGAAYSDRVAVRLTGYDKRGYPDGAVIKLLGNADSIRSRIDAAVISHSIKEDFDEETLEVANKISEKIPARELEKRLDLRNDMVFTIDGSDAKDFDDAVSIRKLPHGRYKLGVHIADVSYYVRPKSRLEAEAFERGTSVYLPDRVIPMLPERLSNEVCSLKPDCDRLTISCIMTVEPDGEVKDYKIKKSVIRSKHRMTYEDVAKILGGDKELCRRYKDILTPLKNMDALADILIRKRAKRGSIDFELPETKAVLENDYEVGELRVCERLKSHRIIEEFMLLANETVARHAVKRGLPFVYRAHAAPDADKLSEFNMFISAFDLGMPKKNVGTKGFLDVLDKVRDKPYETIVMKNMLRAMMKADYRTSNDGHFGLASEYYCHFTSPIRRYPDLMVHRVLTAAAEGHLTAKYKSMCSRAATRSSETERLAEECERSVDSLLKAAYMSKYVGCEYDAVISAVSDYGMYAELENTIEGMIPLESIHGDYYITDKSRSCIKGRRTGKTIRVGETVRIVVSDVDLNVPRITFTLKKDFGKGRRKWVNLK